MILSGLQIYLKKTPAQCFPKSFVKILDHLFPRAPSDTAYFMYKLQQPTTIQKYSLISTFQVCCTRKRSSRQKVFISENPWKWSMEKLVCSEFTGCKPASLLKKLFHIYFLGTLLSFFRTHYDDFFRRGFETMQTTFFLSENL